MKYDPNKHHRRSIRLKAYDYSQAGMYFITLCCNNRECLFGQIHNGTMELNDAGRMVEIQWLALKNRFQNIELNESVVMPNHFHAILEIVGSTLVTGQNGTDTGDEYEKGQPQGLPQQVAQRVKPTNKTVGDIVGAFESITTVEYIRGVKNNNWQTFDKKLWQRNYWEHIIRDERSYLNISEYIANNPAKWDNDALNQKA